MMYRDSFDRLGRPTPLPKLQRHWPRWVHRCIRWASVGFGAVCLFILIWVR